jgi:hypothetical protein
LIFHGGPSVDCCSYDIISLAWVCSNLSFWLFPAELILLAAGPDWANNQREKCPRPDSDPFNDIEFEKTTPARQAESWQTRTADSFTPHSNDKVI